MPTSSQARVLAPVYTFEAGSSPTRITCKKGGRFPFEVHSSTSSRTRFRTNSATFLPSMISALMLSFDVIFFHFVVHMAALYANAFGRLGDVPVVLIKLLD